MIMGHENRWCRAWMLAVGLVLVVQVLSPGVLRAAPQEPSPPQFTYHHMWTDAQGVSHIATCPLTRFVLKSMSPPAGPQWQDRQPDGRATVLMTVQPPHWDGTWHEDPKVQWIVPLHGRWFVQAMDGARVEMGPGDVLLGEDQNTRPFRTGPMQGRRGHLGGNVGDGAVDLMVVQMDISPTIGQPCHFH
ncbi:cupin domain-containing protein [Novacetimonas sp. GS1]|uniref:cupin domain-containing protein n=1 Tax=Novacetimonas TaxID=2919364 RepID=UPI002FCD539A